MGILDKLFNKQPKNDEKDNVQKENNTIDLAELMKGLDEDIAPEKTNPMSHTEIEVQQDEAFYKNASEKFREMIAEEAQQGTGSSQGKLTAPNEQSQMSPEEIRAEQANNAFYRSAADKFKALYPEIEKQKTDDGKDPR